MGLDRSGLVELAPGMAGAEAACVTMAAELVRQRREAGTDGQTVLWIDRDGDSRLSGTAAVMGGGQAIVLRPSCDADAWWACEQAARCPSVAAIIARLGSSAAGDVAARRLKLAQEAGGGLVVLVHPSDRTAGGACWSDLRLSVRYAASESDEPLPLCWQPEWSVEVLYRRGGLAGQRLTLTASESDETPTLDDLLTGEPSPNHEPHRTKPDGRERDVHPLPLAAELADPTRSAWAERPPKIDRRLRRPIRRPAATTGQQAVGRPA